MLLDSRVREQLVTKKKVEEKKMMGGLTFMVDNKMFLGIVNDDLMARIGSDNYDQALKYVNCRKIDFTRREMKGNGFIDERGTDRDKDLIK